MELVAGVDRKSNDKTYDIIREYADILFTFDFNDNFSKIRNELIKKSSGDWILIADGHETFFGIEKIPQMLLEVPDNVKAIAFHIEMSPEEGGTIGQQIRLFRNLDGVKYEGAVHNKLNIDKSGSSFATDLIKVYHERDRKKRTERYGQRQKMVIEKFQEVLKDNPNDARANYYIGTWYLSSSIEKDESGAITDQMKVDKDKVAKSIPYLERYIQVSDFYEEIYLAKWYLAQAYYHIDNREKTKEIAFNMFEQMHEMPLAQQVLGELYLKDAKDKNDKRRLALAEFWFKSALNKKIPFVSCFFPKAFFTYLPWDRLTEIYSRLGHITDAILAGQKTLEFEDYPESKKAELLRCMDSWKQYYKEQTGVDIEDIDNGGSRDRKHDNVHTVNIGN